MKIVLSGVETINRGAELMLYAILQEIERKYPNADVYIDSRANIQGLGYIKTALKLHYWQFSDFFRKTHSDKILNNFHLPTSLFENLFVEADYVFDGSGFCFSDQCGLWGRSASWWEYFLKRQYAHGAKIIFLPQAFGPLETPPVKDAIKVLNKYSCIIMPRERVSYDYLKKSELVDMKKVKLFPDFTSLVEGTFPAKYAHLRNGICIIPNKKMIAKGCISFEKYISLMEDIIEVGKNSGRVVYILNHEGKGDEELAYQCSDKFNSKIEVVSGLNALDTKGLISSAYVVITSRFHGLASALNSCVPSFATSWSHKYSELFRDYLLEDCVLPLDNNETALAKIRELLVDETNKQIREKLKARVPEIKKQTHDMWNVIWE